jgi:5'-deoxynucleotidase YfbR-like HD superfamily hydrolase
MPSPQLYAGDTILTYSGHYINVFEPDPEHICIEDIAHGLSHVPRFAGQTRKVISVAEHCVYVCNAVPEPFKLEALLHDASEAYLMDIPKPIKRLLPDYVALEQGLMKAISDKFRISHPNSDEVKRADKEALKYEHYQLRVCHGQFHTPLSARKAKMAFLAMYDKIILEVSNGR